MKAIAGIVLIPVAFITMCVMVVVFGATQARAGSGCGLASAAGTAVTGTIPEHVGQWNKDQLTMAATLLDAAGKLGVNQQAQTILIMTAMGESSLSNPDHGDAVDNTTIGVLQQGASYGPREARLDPTTAATAFLTRLVNLDGWEALEPTIAAHRVQINADPFHYRPFWSDAQQVVAALTGAGVTSGCVVSGDAKQLAGVLAAARNDGRITGYSPAMLDQFAAVADGTASAQCQIDPRLLQALVMVLNKYGSFSMSDLNRPCAGSSLNCAFSLHCKQPSMAVDFNSVGGHITLGGDATSIELIGYLDTILPVGAEVGQAQCRPAGFVMTNLRTFEDACSHLHVDLGATTEPLRAG